jgi:hypothetical protein
MTSSSANGAGFALRRMPKRVTSLAPDPNFELPDVRKRNKPTTLVMTTLLLFRCDEKNTPTIPNTPKGRDTSLTLYPYAEKNGKEMRNSIIVKQAPYLPN